MVPRKFVGAFAKDLEYKFQEQMKSFEDKHNTPYKQANKQNKNYSEGYDTISEETEWSDKLFTDSSSNEDSSTSSNSNDSNSTNNHSPNKKKSKFTNKKKKKKKKDKRHPTDDSLCKQSLAITELLGTMRTRKLDLKHEPKARRTAFLEWLSNLEVALNSCKYTRRILQDYNTSNKIRKVKYNSVNRMVYSICYALMEKSARISTMTYKEDGIGLLRALHTKCASVDSQTRLRAKTAFIECRISQEETAINFLTRLEQKANEARNFDIKISEKKFIYRLLNNMKYHKYYRSRIESLLTQFELNSNIFNQRWLENKFYALDEERVIHSKLGIKPPTTARYTQSPHNGLNKRPNNKRPTKRCKYCYKNGHNDQECRDKQMKRPPSMPKWVGNAQCNKCKKKGHLSFNCPPKFNNQKRKTPKLDRYLKYKKNDDKPNVKKEETAAVAQVEFAGYTTCVPIDPTAESAFLTHT